MTPQKLSIAALVACVIWFAVLLFSPVMGPDTFGGDSSCGSFRSLIASGGETRNNGGDITGQQFDDRVDNCRTAFEQQLPFLLAPLALGATAVVAAVALRPRNREAARV